MEDILALLSRWAHILAAVIAVGGTVFARFAFHPAAACLPEDVARQLHEEVRRRWAKLLAGAILLLLASGFYNLWVTLRTFSAAGVDPPGFYHAVFGVKFLFALGVFYIASVLAGKSERTAAFRERRELWATLGIVLAVLVILASGLLRSTHTAPTPPAAAAGPAVGG